MAINEIDSIEALDEYLTKSANRKNRLVRSKQSEELKKNRNSPFILGIDEAGRGPVLGPMVYAVLFCEKSQQNRLKELACVDSKLLNETKRDKIFANILSSAGTSSDSASATNSIGWYAKLISAEYISNEMLDYRKISLNQISIDAAKELVRRTLDDGYNLTEIYVDTVGPAESYRKTLEEQFPHLKIVVESKADLNYPVVSGASICAKVCRDHALKCWQFDEIVPGDWSGTFGSGYPNDPVTKKFLTEVNDKLFGFPSLVRFSWSTAERLLETGAAQCTWIDDDERAENQRKPKKQTAMAAAAAAAFEPKKMSFWNEHNLHLQFDDFF